MCADTTTTNYAWVKPDPFGSDTTWGTKLNTDLDGIDSQVHANQTAASSASTAAGNAQTTANSAQTAAAAAQTAANNAQTTANSKLPEAPTDGKQYARQSAAWSAVAAGGSSVTVSDTAPASPKAGDLWWDSVGGQLYVWYQDANSSQWVVANNVSAQPITDTHYRNRVINGDMSCDQRNGGAPVAVVGNMYAIDRWKFYSNVAPTMGTLGQTPVTPPLAGLAAQYLLRWTTTSAHALAAADVFQINQFVEGGSFNDAHFGVAIAEPLVLEFWAASTLTGTFGGTLQNGGQDRSYVFTYSIPTANMWTKVRINIPGDTAGTWSVAGNAIALILSFGLGVGSTGSATASGAWRAGNFSGVTGAANILGTINAALSITGVALMVGAAAANAEPEFRKYSDNLIDCQRYYQIIAASARFGASAASVNLEHSLNWMTMRATPSATVAVAGTPANLLGGFPALNSIQPYGSRFSIASAAAGDCYALAYSYALDADF
jgi:hypothetical protein